MGIARTITYPTANAPEFAYPLTREECQAVLNIADSELRKAVETADRYRARLTDELTPEEQLAVSTMIEFWAHEARLWQSVVNKLQRCGMATDIGGT